MKFEGYDLWVPQAVDDDKDARYAYLRHGQQFHIGVRNNKPTRCNVTLTVNGVEVGTWRLDAYSQVLLEHPADHNEKFTFYREGSAEARRQGLRVGEANNGVIVARFVPEDTTVRIKSTYRWKDDVGYPEDYSVPAGGGSSARLTSHVISSTSTTPAAGAIGYSGYSGQQFTDAAYMATDEDQAVEIAIRLLCRPEPIRPKVVSRPKSTGIPPRK